MGNGAMSRKVEITLNSAVSLVQTLQPLLFIHCYKSGGGIDIDRKDTFPQRGETKEYDNTSYQPPLAYNVLSVGEVYGLKNKDYD